MADTATFWAFTDGFTIAEESVALIGCDMQGNRRFCLKRKLESVGRDDSRVREIIYRDPSKRPSSDITPQTIFRMIQQAMREQQEGIRQIMEALKRMNEITYQVRTGSREMNTGNSMVLEEMNRLQNASIEIKNNIDEMARGSTEVTGETLRLSELAGDTRKTILRMERILKGFKVE